MTSMRALTFASSHCLVEESHRSPSLLLLFHGSPASVLKVKMAPHNPHLSLVTSYRNTYVEEGASAAHKIRGLQGSARFEKSNPNIPGKIRRAPNDLVRAPKSQCSATHLQ